MYVKMVDIQTFHAYNLPKYGMDIPTCYLIYLNMVWISNMLYNVSKYVSYPNMLYYIPNYGRYPTCFTYPG